MYCYTNSTLFGQPTISHNNCYCYYTNNGNPFSDTQSFGSIRLYLAHANRWDKYLGLHSDWHWTKKLHASKLANYKDIRSVQKRHWQDQRYNPDKYTVQCWKWYFPLLFLQWQCRLGSVGYEDSHASSTGCQSPRSDISYRHSRPPLSSR